MTYICNDIIVSRARLTGPRDEVPDGALVVEERESPLYAAGIIGVIVNKYILYHL